MKRIYCLRIALLVFVTLSIGCHRKEAASNHPQILVTPGERASVSEKLQQIPWAGKAFEDMKARIDPLVEKTKSDPQFVASRMLMNWDTQYKTTLVEKSRTVGGEGRAEVPTPRFEGARDWASGNYALPDKIEDMKPCNDQGGKMYLLNKKTGKSEWADPGDTGALIRNAHSQMLNLAAEAGFLYWITGDEKYARFGADILWPWMQGFAATAPPKPVTPDKGMESIIGPTSFEVIHEGAVMPAALAYDFLEPYLLKQGRDTRVIQGGFKRWADRVIEGGSRDGNWNLNQTMMIAYAGLALEPNASYPDGKGREFYADIVLNADLPAQKGLNLVMQDGFDRETMLWPEAAGYGFGSAGQIIELASLLAGTPQGQALLASPDLMRSVMNQGELVYPNGLSEGVGDTTSTRVNAIALENLLAAAVKRGDADAAAKLSAYLRREIDSGSYTRGKQADIAQLVRFVGELPSDGGSAQASRAFWFPGLNIWMQRNVAPDGDPAASLAAAMFGTAGGHVHQNGLAIELYGAGFIQGADPGRGSSYWQKDHREYYVSPVAHNTVVVNATSSYHEYKDPKRAMVVESAEPASQTPALSPDISFARASFSYAKPAVEQQRTLALVRTGDKSGFYFDVFRSKAAGGGEEFHDYFYHNMGTLGSISAPLAPSSVLASQQGALKGYTYFQNERSGPVLGDLSAVFTMNLPGRPSMAMWLTAQDGRTVFSVDAPQNNAIREAIAPIMRGIPMPTIVVRQQGEAWQRPFVAVYEPFLEGKGTVRSVRGVTGGSVSGAVVEGDGYRALLLQDAAADGVRQVENANFQGDFGAVIERGGEIAELYLGNGKLIEFGGWKLEADAPTSIDVRRRGEGWVYGATGPVKINGRPLPPARDRMVEK